MPIIASAKKQMRQNIKSNIRNHAQLSNMRSLYKNIVKWVEAGEKDKAKEFFDEAQKAIDTCAKKNLIHMNNASRKKSRIARLLQISTAKKSKSSNTAPTDAKE